MLLSISAINFSGKTAISSPEKKSALSLKSLTKDEVSFGSHFPMEQAMKYIAENIWLWRWRNSEIISIKPIEIKLKKNNKNPVEAFMATIKWEVVHDYFGKKGIGLAVFSKNGNLLGSIEELDSKECAKENKGIGTYMHLKCLNSSYSDNYKGVGTALIEEAVEKSKEMGLGGQLKVEAYNYLRSEKGSPIPFYAKKGFIDYKNPHLTEGEIIAKYADDPEVKLTMFLLSPENKKKLLKSNDNAKYLNPFSHLVQAFRAFSSGHN